MTGCSPLGCPPCPTSPPFPWLLPEPHSNVLPYLPLPHGSQAHVGLQDLISSRIDNCSPSYLREKQLQRAQPGDLLPPCSGELESPRVGRGTKETADTQMESHQCTEPGAEGPLPSPMLSTLPFISQQRGCGDISIHVCSSKPTDALERIPR